MLNIVVGEGLNLYQLTGINYSFNQGIRAPAVQVNAITGYVSVPGLASGSLTKEHCRFDDIGRVTKVLNLHAFAFDADLCGAALEVDYYYYGGSERLASVRCSDGLVMSFAYEKIEEAYRVVALTVEGHDSQYVLRFSHNHLYNIAEVHLVEGFSRELGSTTTIFYDDSHEVVELRLPEVGLLCSGLAHGGLAISAGAYLKTPQLYHRKNTNQYSLHMTIPDIVEFSREEMGGLFQNMRTNLSALRVRAELPHAMSYSFSD